jgi:hypothetical protein
VSGLLHVVRRLLQNQTSREERAGAVDKSDELLATGGVPPLLARILAVVLCFSPLFGVAQSIDKSKVATVHVYRKGRLSVRVSLSADGTKIGSLTPHKMVTFYLFPGYHELILQSGETSPGASFKAKAGGEYFFRLDYEHVISATSLRDLSLSLTMQPKAF